MINNKKQNQAGFTLVELSIVLVIIGLIVSGVLAGQALIEQAKVRGQLRQIEEIKTALGAFTAKYNFLPGDLPNPERFLATGLGSGATAFTIPNGNGYVEGVLSSTAYAAASTEANLAIPELFAAGLVKESANRGGAVLPTRFRKTAGIALNAGAAREANYIIIGVPTAVSGANYTGVDALTAAGGITGLEAYAIDSKVDDGSPVAGQMYSISGQTVSTSTLANPKLTTTAGCHSTTFYYADQAATASATTGSAPACNLAYKSGF